jgi:hypothetical protein
MQEKRRRSINRNTITFPAMVVLLAVSLLHGQVEKKAQAGDRNIKGHALSFNGFDSYVEVPNIPFNKYKASPSTSTKPSQSKLGSTDGMRECFARGSRGIPKTASGCL